MGLEFYVELNIRNGSNLTNLTDFEQRSDELWDPRASAVFSGYGMMGFPFDGLKRSYRMTGEKPQSWNFKEINCQ